MFFYYVSLPLSLKFRLIVMSYKTGKPVLSLMQSYLEKGLEKAEKEEKR